MPDGYKLSDEVELSIEKSMEESVALPSYSDLGRARRLEDTTGRYIEFAKSTFPKSLRLDGLKIVVDAAHGAAYKVASAALWELGAEVISIGNQPNGLNINDQCGATHPEFAKKILLEQAADLAVILDGDADRLVMVDHQGNTLDGDKILALIATHLFEKNSLKGGAVVATQMSNLGLERYIKSLGLDFIRTNIGDRYVIEAMHQHACNLGGEQSGHMILHDHTTTGDGLIAALQVLAVMREQEKNLAEMAHIYTSVPQITHNVTLKKSVDLEEPNIQELLQMAQAKIGPSGHLLVRASGTEPVMRLMAQGDDLQTLTHVIQELSDYFSHL